ncbi:pirin family protein [Chryseobacterium aureum]|uniref:pirin family protein n=1 Tax=Chryseobacterium aureum TaxID=2497456 RepID=UPI000F89B36E|nr:pirin family protein [Chryseobacterium aureum]
MHIVNKASERQKAGHGNFSINIVIPGKNTADTDLGFFNLGRFDDAHLKPGAFIGMHPHKNDEILTLMRSGTMLHKDSTGKEIAVTPRNLMLMNAGSGIYHEESIPEDRYREDVRLLQIFVRPEFENDPPKVQFADAGQLIPNQWRLVAGLKDSNAPLEIRSNILIYDIELTDAHVKLPTPYFKDPVYFIYIFDGGLNTNEVYLQQGDSIIYDNESEVSLAGERCTLICFEMDRNASFTRNGMYSGMNR